MSRESRVDDRPGLRTQRAKSASTFKLDSFRRTWKYSLNPNPKTLDLGSLKDSVRANSNSAAFQEQSERRK